MGSSINFFSQTKQTGATILYFYTSCLFWSSMCNPWNKKSSYS